MLLWPDAFRHPVANNSDEWNFEAFNCDRENYPPLPVARTRPAQPGVPVLIEPGQLLGFSAAHLHAGTSDASGRTRFGVDTRSVWDPDRGSGRGAPNVDGAAQAEMWRWFARAASPGGTVNGATCPRGGHRRRCRRRRHPVSPGAQGLVGCGTSRAQGTDLGFDVARRRPPAAVQHELLGGSDPQVLRQSLSNAAGDRLGRGPAHRRQHTIGDDAGPHGRVPPVRGRRAHHRRQRRIPYPGRGARHLAAGGHGWTRRRHPPPRRRLHSAGRSHPGAGARRPTRGRLDPSPNLRRRVSSRHPAASG